MGGSYLIAGRNVSSHYLAITTLATFGLGAFAISKRIKSKKPNTPPINASSADEEAFIKEFLKHAEEEEKKVTSLISTLLVIGIDGIYNLSL